MNIKELILALCKMMFDKRNKVEVIYQGQKIGYISSVIQDKWNGITLVEVKDFEPS